MPRAGSLLPGLVAVVALSGCGSDDAGDSSKAASVNVETFQFSPDPLVVAAGTVITFTNEDKIDHTVTAGTREAPTPDVFDGSLPQQGATFELVLDEPGTYEYFCRIHNGPGMTATITVE